MEPDPMPQEIVEQDILLDDIKEYRKILSGLLMSIDNAVSEECKSVLDDFNISLLPEYSYAYSGLDNILRDVDEHKEEIRKIMTGLEANDDTDSKNIYQECYECYIYQYYYLGNYNI